MFRSLILAMALVSSALVSSAVVCFADAPPMIERYLTAGKLSDGKKALLTHLEKQPKDDQARFGLGTLEFLQSVEHLGQSLYRYGALGPESRLTRLIPFVRMNVPANPAPEPVKYDDVRTVLKTLVSDLAQAEKTLAAIEDKSVQQRLHFGQIVLDIVPDGKAGEEEKLWRMYAALNRGLDLHRDFERRAAEEFVIAFDYGDVCWLRGYCHLLSAMSEAILAYDEETFFNLISRHIFAKPVSPLPAEAQAPLADGEGFNSEIADAIAGIHNFSFALKEPERMKLALGHFKEVLRLSRESWHAIEAETDNDREWVPNSSQDSVIPNVRVTKEMIAGWKLFLDEAEKTLDGKQLMPHWRFKDDYGINLRRVFEEPKPFDLVMWAHGAAALPYAEKGTVANEETRDRLQRLFGGQFIGFAFWFN